MAAKSRIFRVEVRAAEDDGRDGRDGRIAVVQTRLVRARGRVAAHHHAAALHIAVDLATPEMCVALGAAGVQVEDAVE